MLATGGSAIGAINLLKKAGCKNIKQLCIIACPEGIEAFTKAHPDVQLFVGTIDKGLNEEGYIVPGLATAATESTAPNKAVDCCGLDALVVRVPTSLFMRIKA